MEISAEYSRAAFQSERHVFPLMSTTVLPLRISEDSLFCLRRLSCSCKLFIKAANFASEKISAKSSMPLAILSRDSLRILRSLIFASGDSLFMKEFAFFRSSSSSFVHSVRKLSISDSLEILSIREAALEPNAISGRASSLVCV